LFMFLRAFFIFVFLASFAKAHPVIYKDGFVYWGEFSNQKNTQILSYTFHPHFAFQVSSGYSDSAVIFGQYRNYLLGLNVLVKRWLLEDSQGNIYTSFNGGFIFQGNNKYVDLLSSNVTGKSFLRNDFLTSAPVEASPFFQWILSADWESRLIYTAGGVKLRGEFSSINEYLSGDFYYRVGFAPYVAGMDTLQTWFVLMFQLSANGYFNKEMRDALSKKPQEQQGPKHPDDPTLIIMSASVMMLDWKITPLLRFFYKNVLWEIGSSLKSDFYITLMIHY